MADLLVSGGTVVTEHDVQPADLLIRGERIAGILAPGTEVGQVDRVIDAQGLHVLPGVVDCHVHFNEPGRTHWEGYITGSSAAAAGGITTFLDMPLNCDPPTLTAEALAIKRDAVANHSLVDYGHWGGMVPGNLDDLAAMHEAGVVGFKAFMCDSGLPEFPSVDDATLLEGMRRIADLGSVLALHAESDALTTALGAQIRAAGRRDPLAWAEARPPFTEEEAVQRALLLARETGARVHFVHISTANAVGLIARARESALFATVETCPHYLILDEDDFERLGPIAKCAPPLRERGKVLDLWDRVDLGHIDCIASDHSPCPPDDKLRGKDDIWQAWGGISGVQTLVPTMLTYGASHRRWKLSQRELTQFVRLTSANPARIFGLYPRKGALTPGSDADLMLVGLDAEWTLTEEDLLTRWRISPFLGRQFHGRAQATLVRGTVVYDRGKVVAQPGHGQLVRPTRQRGAVDSVAKISEGSEARWTARVD